MNSKLAKKYGTPHNASTGKGGPDSGTHAAKRGMKNSTISGKKFIGTPRGCSYGVKGV